MRATLEVEDQWMAVLKCVELQQEECLVDQKRKEYQDR